MLLCVSVLQQRKANYLLVEQRNREFASRMLSAKEVLPEAREAIARRHTDNYYSQNNYAKKKEKQGEAGSRWTYDGLQAGY